MNEDHKLGPCKSKTKITPFLCNITNDDDTLPPFFTLTVLPSSTTFDRKRSRAEAITTKSALVDTGAIDSDYVRNSFLDSIKGLEYVANTSIFDSVETPSEHLPAIKCLGIVILRVGTLVSLS